MKTRWLAAVLLAPLAMGGCDRNPTGAGTPLVGGWESDEFRFTATAPNGSTDVFSRDEWSFQADGTYARTDVLVDASTGRRWVMYAEKGSWRVEDDVLRLVVREEFHVADPAHAADVPALVPVDPWLTRSRWYLQGPTLFIEPICEIGVYCVSVPLHRMAVAVAF
jgi:hypothetical protein